jgi:fibronectin type 3 domain-containing protein
MPGRITTILEGTKLDQKTRTVSLLLAAAVLLLCIAIPPAVSASLLDKGNIGIMPTLGRPTQLPKETPFLGKFTRPPRETLFPGKPTQPPVETPVPGKPTEPPKETTTPDKFTATPQPTVTASLPPPATAAPKKITPRQDTRPVGTLVIYSAPTGLAAEALPIYNHVRLSWDQVPGAQGYKVYRTAAIDQPFTQVDPDEGDWSSPDVGQGSWYAFYDRLSMEPYTERFYKVSAVFVGGREGPMSDWAHVLALDPPPEHLTALALRPDLVFLSWSPSVGGADRYVITRLGNDGEVGLLASETVFIDGLNPNVGLPLQSDTEYRYQVTAVKNEIWQLSSDWVTVRTPLETPNNVAATPISTSQIQITWDPVPGATGYKIYHNKTNGDIFAYLGYSTTTVYNHNGLDADTFHAYKVVAYNEYGESAVSENAVTRTR